MNAHSFTLPAANGSTINLSDYEGKVLIIVNTASKCGFTHQYDTLQALYEAYHDKGLEIIAVPSNQFDDEEPGTNDEIQEFCKLNFGVTFPVAAKSDVRDETALPLFKYLTEQQPFKGFNPSNRTELLDNYLHEHHPHYFDDDSIKWNFTKFVINQNGDVVARFEPVDDPASMVGVIKDLLK